MKDKNFEKQLKSQTQNITPDVWDKIEERVRVLKPSKQEKKNSFFGRIKNNLKPLVVLATAFVLLISGALMFLTNSGEYSTIAFDINPSIELTLNKDNQVLSVTNNNQDATTLLQNENLVGLSLENATAILFEKLVQNEYLNEEKNSVLVSVKSKNAAFENELKLQIENHISNSLGQSGLSISLMMQGYRKNDIATGLAQELGVSVPKALFIEKILQADPQMQAEDLALLSINELNLLIEAKQVALEGMQIKGRASSSAYLTEEEIKSIIATELDIELSQILETEIVLSQKGGSMIFEVEIEILSISYNFQINALTGVIIQQQNGNPGNQNGNN